MKIKFIPIFLAYFLFFPSCSLFKSDIKEINSLVEAQTELNKADAKTLVVFDMDDTLIYPTSNMFLLLYRNTNDFDKSDINFVNQIRLDFKKFVDSKHDNEYWNKVNSDVFAKTDFVPVEDKTVEIVKNLQNKKVKVIALTSSNTGKFEVIDSMEKWREKNLNQVGLDFSKSFNIQEIVFDNFPKLFGFPPVFYKGILCAAGSKKGPILKSFLEKINFKPDTVIFFDDMYEQCKSVENEMKKSDIPVQCFWYRGAYKNKIKLNQEVVNYQFEHWKNHEEFLTEKEVVEQLN
ncbi:MAG: DUF2608 domain-containing protein [bacterium]